MFRFYKLTPLEQFVEDLYNAHGISSPKLLTIREIARRLNVWVYFKPIVSKGLEINPNIYTINIDSRLSPIKQWLDFLHELGHLLRHAGNQTILPKLFTQAQETEAENFVLYAAMPFFMISQFKLPGNRKDAIHFLAAAFKVPFKLAEKRLDQIQRREFEGTLMNSYIRFNVDRNIQPTPHIDEVETKIYAYYDSSGDSLGPTQIIIHVDQQTLLTQEELTFSHEGPFERIEEGQLHKFIDSKPIKFHDLDYRDGYISLRLNHLASRYYNSANKFIIQMKEIEDLMMFHGEYF